MAYINYDDYRREKYQDYINTINATIHVSYWFLCSYCNHHIMNAQRFHYCPYCGNSLFIKERKETVYEHLERILYEIEEIKKKMESEK